MEGQCIAAPSLSRNPPHDDVGFGASNRYLYIETPSTTDSIGIRVTATELPVCLADPSLEGSTRWASAAELHYQSPQGNPGGEFPGLEQPYYTSGLLPSGSPPNFENGMAQPSSKREIIEAFESSLAEARRNLSSLDDERMVATWRMSLGEGVPALEMPRAAMLRSILLNHLYHHRGQLGVYLRLLGASVPSAYGPSGDEMPDVMGAAAV